MLALYSIFLWGGRTPAARTGFDEERRGALTKSTAMTALDEPRDTITRRERKKKGGRVEEDGGGGDGMMA